MSFDSNYIRNNKLIELSQMVVNGHITFKLDFIAHISINNHYYFSVFRRYNNPYNIVIEDCTGDVHVHQDATVRESLRNILCLTKEVALNMYTYNAFSYKHNGPISCDIADLMWTELQSQYEAVNVDFRGILQDYHDCIKVEDECPSTPVDCIIPSVELPTVPSKPINGQLSDVEAARVLCSIDIPKMADLDEVRECDGPTLSMRFADIKRSSRDCLRTCYCSADYEEEEELENDENNYTILRSGNMIPKFQ
jgi:hypothetical protein